jgi:hypothetical protein
MYKTIFTLTALALFSVSSVSAADNQCYKALGNTPNEAFLAAAEVLNNADAEMGPGWMKDNMQIRLLPNKINGQFVALVYSAVHSADTCNLTEEGRVADQSRTQSDHPGGTI